MDVTSHNQDAACGQVADALTAYFDGEADAATREIATAHLENCAACAHMWQEWRQLQTMEQQVMEPVAVPRHLQNAILQKTSRAKLPLWQRLWPRIVVGAAVPATAVACWLLLMASPWQQMPENVPISSSVPETTVQKTPVTSRNAPPRTAKIPKQEKTVVNSPSPQLTEIADDTTSVSTPPVQRRKAKSTFHSRKRRRAAKRLAPVSKKPQISLAIDRPNSRVAKAITGRDNVKPTKTSAPPRVTPPQRVTSATEIADDSLLDEEEDSEDAATSPILAYIAAHDVRPDNIRDAVENYRAALLDDGSGL